MGRPQFETIVASVLREETVFTGIVKTETIVASIGSELVEIYSPKNTISQIVDMRLNAQAIVGGTTGNHHIYLRYGYPFIFPLDARSTPQKDVTFSYGYWYSADITAQPNSTESQVLLSRNIVFDDETPLTIVYENFTNADQTKEREYYLVIKQRQKA